MIRKTTCGGASVTPSDVVELLDTLSREAKFEQVSKPWGWMYELTIGDLLVKHITVMAGDRTSLQYHKDKDEVIVILEGAGDVMCDGNRFIGVGTIVRIPPHAPHRVTGPLRYLEFSTNHPNDVVRIADDYGR